MQTTRPTIGKYMCGMAASLILFLAGGWLILAPFALGYQAYGADWTNQTVNDFAMGIAVAVVALLSLVLFVVSLLRSLVTAGVLISQPRPQPQQTSVQFQPQAVAPQAAEPYQSDLDKTLSTLAAALAADLTARRQAQAGSDQQNDQSIDQVVNRSDAQ